MTQLHTVYEWNKIYLQRARRYLFWAKVALFFLWVSKSEELCNKADECQEFVDANLKTLT